MLRGFAYAQQDNQIRLTDRRNVDLVCEVVSRDWEVPFRHRCVDLSTKGVWMETSFPLALGEIVVVCMEPEGWRLGLLTVFARVVRRNTPQIGQRRGMGLEFIDLLPYEREELARYLRRGALPPKVHWSDLAQQLLAA
jgi:c-di-GMP-binding flagellar brake protein YcgR